MITLKQKIQQELNEAVKKNEGLKSSVLRLLLAAILNKEKEKRYRISKEKTELKPEELEKESQLTDEEVIEVISSEVKKRKEAILEFSAYAEGYGGQGKIEKAIEKEKQELEIFKKYLPEQLSEKEIRRLAKEVIAVLRASLSPRSTQGEAGAPEEREKFGIKDMGRVMAELMPKVKGRADGNLVSKIVKELLTPK